MVALHPDVPRNERDEYGNWYWVTTGPAGFRIRWHEGPLAGHAINGATPDLVIRAAIQRLEFLDASLSCRENREAIGHLNGALFALDKRVRDRHERGVLGQAVP